MRKIDFYWINIYFKYHFSKKTNIFEEKKYSSNIFEEKKNSSNIFEEKKIVQISSKKKNISEEKKIFSKPEKK